MFLFGPCFSMKTTPRKPSNCLDSKNQGKKSDKTRKLGFLRQDCAQGGEESRKPTKIQGNPRQQKTKCFGWISAPKKGLCIHLLGYIPHGFLLPKSQISVCYSQTFDKSLRLLFWWVFFHQNVKSVGSWFFLDFPQYFFRFEAVLHCEK